MLLLEGLGHCTGACDQDVLSAGLCVQTGLGVSCSAQMALSKSSVSLGTLVSVDPSHLRVDQRVQA